MCYNQTMRDQGHGLDGQTWLLATQQRIADQVGEPILLIIRVPFDDWFEVEIHTFNARFGQGNGRDVEAAIAAATEMLLELDEVIAEVQTKQAEQLPF